MNENKENILFKKLEEFELESKKLNKKLLNHAFTLVSQL